MRTSPASVSLAALLFGVGFLASCGGGDSDSSVAPSGAGRNRGSGGSVGGSSSAAGHAGTSALAGHGGSSAGTSGAAGHAGTAGASGHAGATGVGGQAGKTGTGGMGTAGITGTGGMGTGGTPGTGGMGTAGMATAGAGGSGTAGTAGSGQAGAAIALGPQSVLQHHLHANRDGLYTDAAFTKAASGGLKLDTAFDGTISGPVYAQVLYVDDPAGKDSVIAATEEGTVFSLDATTGAMNWMKSLGAPATGGLPCGNINPLGVTGTPVIDPATRTLYVDAMTTPDQGKTFAHLVYALSVDDGSVVSGWPVNVNQAVTAPVQFDSSVQNERGALLLFGGTLYVPYGGHYGDCGTYHGWVVAISTANPAQVSAWSTAAKAGGIWAPGGLSSDGESVFGATGNTYTTGASWGSGEGVLRFGAGASFTGQTADFFAASNWMALDNGDLDLSGSGPLVFDLPGSTPSKLIAQLGKDGNVYLLDRTTLGGFGAQVAMKKVSSDEVIQAGAVYTTATATYVVFRGAGVGCPTGGGQLTALKVTPGSPPTVNVAWCADQHGRGSPMVTTTDGTNEAVVWATNNGNNGVLYGFDGDTGDVIFSGGGNADKMGALKSYITPIAAKGRIFVGGDDKVYSFTP